ncbi:MAG TPA: hypothetical protein VGO78_26960 [Acidimicrobiales bacterium]|nr:hypothetical protein [Acidimicrobiales bacterium]
MNLPLTNTLTRTRLGVLAGALGAAGALTLVAAGGSSPDSRASFRNTSSSSSSDEAPGDISGPCDEAEHANDAQCAGVAPTTGATTPTTAAPAAPAAPSSSAAGSHTLPTAGGTVVYRSSGTSLTLVSATPARGWRVEVEQRSGREIELDFRAGSRRVQVNVEIEDGQARERVRVRDDADGTDVRVEDGAVVANDDGAGHDVGDDHGGNSGSDNSGSGSSGSGHSGGTDDNPHGSDD